MPRENWRQSANKYLNIRVDFLERTYQKKIVAHKFFLIIWPVPRIGIVQAQVDDDDVRLKSEGIFKLLRIRIGPMPFFQKGGTTLPKIPHFIAFSHQLFQLRRIGQSPVLQTRPKSHRIADASNLYLHLGIQGQTGNRENKYDYR